MSLLAVWTVALAKLEDVRAFEPLLARLDPSPSYINRTSTIAKALGILGDKRAVKPLIACLSAQNPELSISASAAEALGKLGDRNAIEPLLAILPNRSYYNFAHYGAYAQALYALGWEPEDAEDRVYFFLMLQNRQRLRAERSLVLQVLLRDLAGNLGKSLQEAAAHNLVALGY